MSYESKNIENTEKIVPIMAIKNIYVMVDELNQKIFNAIRKIQNGGSINIINTPRDKKYKIKKTEDNDFVTVTLKKDSNEEIISLTIAHKAVMDAIFTLAMAKINIFTFTDLHRIMMRNPKAKAPTAKQINEYKKIINDLERIAIDLDYTYSAFIPEEDFELESKESHKSKTKYIKKIENEPLISLNKFIAKKNGCDVECFEFAKSPFDFPTLQYCVQRERFTKVEPLIPDDKSEKRSNTCRRKALVWYLQEKVAITHHSKRTSFEVNFKTINEKANLNLDLESHLNETVKLVKSILEQMKKLGTIVDCDIRYTGKKAIGITVFLKKNSSKNKRVA